MKHKRLAYLILAILATTAVAGDLYKWKDSNGVTHYSESPPSSFQQTYQAFIIQNPKPSAASNTPMPVNQSPACTTARHNLQVLSENSKVMIDNDGDGKAETSLNAEQRAQQKALAEEAVKASCLPNSSH